MSKLLHSHLHFTLHNILWTASSMCGVGVGHADAHCHTCPKQPISGRSGTAPSLPLLITPQFSKYWVFTPDA